MGIYRVHPNFRVVVLANPPERGVGEWLGTEMMHLFDFHDLEVRPVRLYPCLRRSCDLLLFSSLFSPACRFPPQLYGATSYTSPQETLSLLSSLQPELDRRLIANISEAASALESLRRSQLAEGASTSRGTVPLFELIHHT